MCLCKTSLGTRCCFAILKSHSPHYLEGRAVEEGEVVHVHEDDKLAHVAAVRLSRVRAYINSIQWVHSHTNQPTNQPSNKPTEAHTRALRSAVSRLKAR